MEKFARQGMSPLHIKFIDLLGYPSNSQRSRYIYISASPFLLSQSYFAQFSSMGSVCLIKKQLTYNVVLRDQLLFSSIVSAFQ